MSKNTKGLFEEVVKEEPKKEKPTKSIVKKAVVAHVHLLNVRDYEDGVKIGEIEEGTEVAITHIDGPWCEIIFDTPDGGGYGWVMTKYLEFI